MAKFEMLFQVAPFDKIENSHFIPTYKKAMEVHRSEIETIALKKKSATYANTIVEAEKNQPSTHY